MRAPGWRCVLDHAAGAVLLLGLGGPVVSAASPAAVPGAPESFYSRLDLETCGRVQPQSGQAQEDEGDAGGHPPVFEAVCPGPEGWEVKVVEADLRFYVTPRRVGAADGAPGETLPAFNTIHTVGEWRGRWQNVSAAGTGAQRVFVPHAFILRYFTDDGSGDAAGRGNMLVVFKVTGEGACHLARVDARAVPDANAVARRLADERAPSFRCGADAPLAVDRNNDDGASGGGAPGAP